jgi:hypothetical protein
MTNQINYEPAFLYAFSVIPQVLAALNALLGVFLLFKFQSLKTSIISFGEQTIDLVSKETFLKLNINNNIDTMLENLKHGILRQDPETVVSQVSGINQEFNRNDILYSDSPQIKSKEENILWTLNHNNNIQFECLKQKGNLRKKLLEIIIHSSTLIVLSILSLPIIPFLIGKSSLIIVFIWLFLSIIWLCYCLYKIFYLTKISFERDY